MKRSNHILNLALNGSQMNHEYASVSIEEQILHSEHSSRMASPMEVLRESPLTHEQQMVAIEMENLGFSDDSYFKDKTGDHIHKDVPLYLNNSPLSVFTTVKETEPLDPNFRSVENQPQLTPLFTPVPSVQPLSSPIISEICNISPCSNTPDQVTTNYDSDDSVADPDYVPHDKTPPISQISSSPSILTQPEITIADSTQIETPSSTDRDIDHQEETFKNCVRRNKRPMPETWKKNKRLTKRNSGEEYITAKGKNKPARNCSKENCKCTQACHTKIDVDTRQNLFESFWCLGDINRQRDFLACNVSSTEAARPRATNSRRKYTLNYTLMVNGKRVSVCQSFFLRTFDISDKMVHTALKKARRDVAHIPSPDKRGRHIPSNKFHEDDIQFAIDHIDLFPAVPAHWCRKDTKKTYLESILNKEKMYDLYKNHCSSLNKKPIGKTSYKELLIKKNIEFHKPRKDQCWCHKFEQLSEEEQKEGQEEYEDHINRKDYAIEEKKSDKMKAKENSKVHVCTFDFEAVLYCPLVLGKPVFYKRKLGSMNFTIHNSVTRQGYCYFWPEYEGNRGSNEVATCLYRYILNLNEVDHLILYSDCCPGQNRNSVIATMLSCVIRSAESNIKTIDYKFLEPGHTYMECDSMHATIERASEFAKIYIPEDWLNVIRLARKDNPYLVQEMDHSDFFNFKEIRGAILPKTIKAVDGIVLEWNNVRWLRFNKNAPDAFFFKSDYWGEFKEVKIKTRNTRSGISQSEITKLYSGQILIKPVKHKDLMSMCGDGTITKNYHEFYENLPISVDSSSTSQTTASTVDDDEMTLSSTRASYLKRRPRKKN